MSHVFISYARDDMQAEDGTLKRLISRLRNNFKIWLDKSDIKPGTNWKDTLQKAVQTSKVVVFLLSEKSAMSDWCEAELDAARSANIPIIPYVYQKTNFPFGMASVNAIFHHDDNEPQQKLERAIRDLAPETVINLQSQLIEQGILHNRSITFADAAQKLPIFMRFVATLDNDDIDLIGLPLTSTSFCSSYLFGRSQDNLGWTGRIQLVLQFSGEYHSSAFIVLVAKHFLSNFGKDFPLRLLAVFGPPRISYDKDKEKYSLNHELEIPTADENQWSDAVAAVQKSLRMYHENRDTPELQIFAQGPLAGIGYELGTSHRGLHYHAEHYHLDRDSRQYYRVLGKLKD